MTEANVSPFPEQMSLRWTIAHMTSETARHAGHADIIRDSSTAPPAAEPQQITNANLSIWAPSACVPTRADESVRNIDNAIMRSCGRVLVIFYSLTAEEPLGTVQT